MPVVRVAQDDRLRLILPAPESVVGRIRVGTPVEIRVESLQRVLQAKVSRFSGQVDAATRTMTTEVDVVNEGRRLKPGMIAHATLRLDLRESTLAIPVQAIRNTSGARKTALVINSSDHIEERALNTGMETPYFVEVLGGLSAGERVVVGSRLPLRAGQLVTAKLVNTDDEVTR
jgi:RND family efflux transporter MFP subunit